MKKTKVVLLIVGVFANLLLGAWMDRTWFRERGSISDQVIEVEQPMVQSASELRPEELSNSHSDSSAELKMETRLVTPVRSSVEYRAAADQEWAKPGANAKAVQGILGQWAQTDPQAAIAWASALPRGEARAGALKTAINSWAKRDGPAAANFAETLPMGKERQQAVASVAGGWGQQQS